MDWVAMGLTLGQMYLLAHRKTLGWPVGLAGSALWAIWAAAQDLWSILTINAILACLAVRGWHSWTREANRKALPPVPDSSETPATAPDGGQQS